MTCRICTNYLRQGTMCDFLFCSVLPKVRLNAPKFAGLNLPIPFPESVANEYCAFDKKLLDKNPLKKEPVW